MSTPAGPDGLPEVRDAVVDLATSKTPAEMCAAERDLMASATPAELELAGRVNRARAEDARQLIATGYRDPGAVADSVAYLNDAGDADMTLYEGLPESAAEFACLQMLRPWPPLEAEIARQIAAEFTPAERDLFTERFGASTPGGIYWPGVPSSGG